MKVGLYDVDGHNFPNLALMKISAWHKSNGDSVHWYNCFDRYDRVYCSKVFDFTPDIQHDFPKGLEVVRGGSGYSLSTKLPDEIEEFDADYSIYPDCKYSLQYFSRGCVRSCPYCIVNKKEGGIRSVVPISLNPNGNHI